MFFHYRISVKVRKILFTGMKERLDLRSKFAYRQISMTETILQLPKYLRFWSMLTAGCDRKF